MPALVRHSAAHGSPAGEIVVQLERDGAGLWLRFGVKGKVDDIAWPEPVMPGRADGLWKQTCFEVFIATDAGYFEYNLSPSGQWASYRFDRYREGMAQAEEGAVLLGLDGASDFVALEARIELPHGAQRLGLSAVIETTNGDMSYWALAHPSDTPDFHHPDSFILDLP